MERVHEFSFSNMRKYLNKLCKENKIDSQQNLYIDSRNTDSYVSDMVPVTGKLYTMIVAKDVGGENTDYIESCDVDWFVAHDNGQWYVLTSYEEFLKYIAVFLNTDGGCPDQSEVFESES